MSLIKIKSQDRGFNNVINLIIAVVSLLSVLPMILILMVSFTDERTVALNGYQLFPKKLTTYAYHFVFTSSTSILDAYKVSIFVTVVGTILSLILTSMFAYPLSRKELKYRNPLSLFVFFTMLFNGGLVPWYILISRYLHLQENIMVLIIPYLVSAWNVMLMRNFFKSLPDSIIEAARIDGCSEFITFVKIVFPLSLPSFATIGLFNALMYWNDWWLAILFISNNKLFPLQYMLQTVMNNIQILSSNVFNKNQVTNLPGETARMALCILATGPIILAYPFCQRYFIQGLTVGAVKG
jgi:putative aldouronate transport system permease protein